MKLLTLTRRVRTARLLVLSLVAGALVATGAASTAQAADTASISGVIQAAGTPNVNLAGAQVSLYNLDASVYRSTETNGSGAFTFSALPAGHYTYSVSVSAGAYSQWVVYGSGSTENEDADYFAVAAGQAVTGKNLVLQKTASVGGRVTAPGGAGVKAHVYAYTQAGKWAGHAVGDDSGYFTIYGLKPGAITLEIFPTTGTEATSPWSMEFWNDKATFATADFFSIGAGQAITDRNVQVAAAGTISGNVKNSSSANLADVYVQAYSSTSGWEYSDYTDASGNYVLDGLPPANYTLRFSSYGGAYATEWWNDQATKNTANPITVASGATVSGRNVVLASSTPGTVSGNVKNAASANIQYSLVYIHGDTYNDSVMTDSSGNFTFPTVPAGSYTLEYTALGYVDSWWNNKTQTTADYFTVGSGQAVTGRNAVLIAESSISGSVTAAAGGAPLASIAVVAYSATAGENSASIAKQGWTDETGAYSIEGLPVGTYKLGFTQAGSGASYATGALLKTKTYASTWYPTAYSYASAGTVTISTAGQNVTGINQSLVYPTFVDVSDPSSAFFPYIEWMYTSNISTGTASYGKPLYSPGNAVSRQAMASFLYKLSGETFTPPGTASFADVAVGSTFFTAIEWMKSKGISTGTPQSSGLPLFKPADAVSRSAMASFLSRYDGVTLTTPTTQSFADVPLSASTAAAIEWMKTSGISTGTAQPSGLPLYKPADPVSRQAMAAFLYRLTYQPS